MPKTVLAVDDDSGSLRRYSATLGKDYNLITAGGSGNALEIVRGEQGASIDLLLTDLDMPLLKGHLLIKEVHRLRPHVKFILASGYGRDAILPYITALQDEGVEGVVPFDKFQSNDELVEVVRSLIGN